MEILNGTEMSKEILSKISFDVLNVKNAGSRVPRLDVILVGDDYGSVKYVGMKEKVAKEIGLQVQVHQLDKAVNTLEIVNLVDSLNKDSNVDGLMIQLPLPEHIDKHLVLGSIDPAKDVDGLTPTNLGKLFQKNPSAIPPATPLGIMKLLEAYNIKIFGKRVVILGSSTIVGKPLAALML